MEMKSESPVNRFQAALLLPDNANQVVSLRDRQGKIDDFRVTGQTLSFITNFSNPKRIEVVEINMKLEDVRDETLAPLYAMELSLPSFETGETKVRIEVPGLRLISTQATFGFQMTLSEDALQFSGQGPIWFKIFYTDRGQGKTYDHYVLFGTREIGEADRLYQIIPQVLGLHPPLQRFPVVILEDERYNQLADPWSNGTYREGGLILLRDSLEVNDRTATLIHETVHAFNAQIMNWNTSQIAWFDEGIAEYIESLVKGKLEILKPNLFIGEQIYSRGGRQYVLFPKSSLDKLYQYYRNGLDFMRDWDPRTSREREFGYAFSELFMRDYIHRNGYRKLQQIYRQLAGVKEPVSNGDEFNRILFSILGIRELRPCYAQIKREIERCVNRINGYHLEVPR